MAWNVEETWFLSDYLLVVMSLVINLISLNIDIFIFEIKENYAKFIAVICGGKKVCEYTEKWMSIEKISWNDRKLLKIKKSFT